MFKKLITKLYQKYCSPDPVAMTRVQTQGTTHTIDVFDLSITDKKNFSAEAKTIINSEVFKFATNNIKARVLAHIQNDAQTMDIIMYDRFTINGVALLEEELQRYASIEFDNPDEALDEFESI